MTFVQPIKVGDLVSIYGDVAKIGNTSITISLETIVQRRLDVLLLDVGNLALSERPGRVG